MPSAPRRVRLAPRFDMSGGGSSSRGDENARRASRASSSSSMRRRRPSQPLIATLNESRARTTPIIVNRPLGASQYNGPAISDSEADDDGDDSDDDEENDERSAHDRVPAPPPPPLPPARGATLSHRLRVAESEFLRRQIDRRATAALGASRSWDDNKSAATSHRSRANRRRRDGGSCGSGDAGGGGAGGANVNGQVSKLSSPQPPPPPPPPQRGFRPLHVHYLDENSIYYMPSPNQPSDDSEEPMLFIGRGL